jgi:hypothetical protein
VRAYRLLLLAFAASLLPPAVLAQAHSARRMPIDAGMVIGPKVLRRERPERLGELVTWLRTIVSDDVRVIVLHHVS